MNGKEEKLSLDVPAFYRDEIGNLHFSEDSPEK